MKKNFLAIASLLIAAMLLVVSCTQEVAPVDNGLVEAKLTATAAGKALKEEHSASNVKYYVTLDALWEATGLMDEIVGEGTKEISDISAAKISLGYISQGLWNVKVEGKVSKDGVEKVVITGNTTTYITKESGKDNVVVFLGTDLTSNQETALSFDITINDLASGNNNYSLKAEIKSADNRTNAFNETKVLTVKSGETDSDHKTAYEGSTKLTPGYYNVTVKLYRGTETVIGGITRGILVLGEDSISITGSVSASDFVNGSLNVKTPKMKINGVTAKVGEGNNFLGTYNNTTQRYEGEIAAGSDNKVSITYEVSAAVDSSTVGDGVTEKSLTYTWYVDGKVQENSNSATYTLTNAEPGFKNVSCIVTALLHYGDTSGSSYDFTVGNEVVTLVRVDEFTASNN